MEENKSFQHASTTPMRQLYAITPKHGFADDYEQAHLLQHKALIKITIRASTLNVVNKMKPSKM